MNTLGIDVGTGGTRAVVIDPDSNVVASATAEHVPFISTRTGWAEQDPEDWWQATITVVREVLSKSSGHEIKAVGFSGQMHGLVLLDGFYLAEDALGAREGTGTMAESAHSSIAKRLCALEAERRPSHRRNRCFRHVAV